MKVEISGKAKSDLATLAPSVSFHRFGLEWNNSIAIEKIALEFCTDIHAHQRMNPNELLIPWLLL